MMTRVSREEFAQALVELLPTLRRGSSPEVATTRIDERTARYIAMLRHGPDQTQGIFLLHRRAQRLSSLVAVVPSPFDRDIFGIPIGKLSTLEVTEHENAAAVVRAAERAALKLGMELLFVRVSPSTRILPALLSRGFQVYGATVLYAGLPHLEGLSLTQVERVTTIRDIAETARLARLAFDDTHLSRDGRLDQLQGRSLYETWVKAEAERGAHIFALREGPRIVATAVVRHNELAQKILGTNQWHLHILAVHPRYRGLGFGLKIAAAAMQAALDARTEMVQTGVDTGGLAAQRIYARLGLLPRNSSLILHRWLKQDSHS